MGSLGKMILAYFIAIGTLWAEQAVLVKVQSENRILVEREGKSFPIRLAGIASFSTAGERQADVPWMKREEFSREATEWLRRKMPVGSTIRYTVIDDGDRGAPFVWLYDEELNYRLVRNGYALVDSSDPYLPGQLEVRLKMAMNYAHSKGLGFWKSPRGMAAMRVKPWYRGNRSLKIQYVKLESSEPVKEAKKTGKKAMGGALHNRLAYLGQ